jgi:hypothetical protein
LIGVAFGVGFAIWYLVVRLHYWEQFGAILPQLNLDSLLGARRMTYILDNALVGSIFGSLLLLLFFFLLRTMFRRMWLASAAFIVGITFALFSTVPSGHLGLFDWISVPLFAVLLVFVLTRFGVLALIVALSISALGDFPLTADFSVWYAGSCLFAVANVLALTGYALYIALAGRPLFKTGFLDSD